MEQLLSNCSHWYHNLPPDCHRRVRRARECEELRPTRGSEQERVNGRKQARESKDGGIRKQGWQREQKTGANRLQKVLKRARGPRLTFLAKTSDFWLFSISLLWTYFIQIYRERFCVTPPSLDSCMGEHCLHTEGFLACYFPEIMPHFSRSVSVWRL